MQSAHKLRMSYTPSSYVIELIVGYEKRTLTISLDLSRNTTRFCRSIRGAPLVLMLRLSLAEDGLWCCAALRSAYNGRAAPNRVLIFSKCIMHLPAPGLILQVLSFIPQ